jgi:hypothetical protein
MLKRAGFVGNAGVTSVVQSLKVKRLRVGEVACEVDENNLVLGTGTATGNDLSAEGFNNLKRKRGTVYT